ncbi:MAG: hypothetical protein HYZ81_07085, partial [Nitrospinae bacterium]|nr:hypothetical protein [Nitrospinota bacterium]
MAAAAIVHVMGTGTIGEPLIGLLTSLREPLGIDEVTFYKHSPTLVDRPKVASLVRRGAVLCVAPDKVEAFHQVGLCPTCTLQEALARATVVIDCSSEGIGLQDKARFYATGVSRARGFIGQGSEFGFGKPYAYAINDGALLPGVDRFLHVVSCNTHNIAVLVKTIALGKDEDADNLIEGRFVCLRRASDISQEGDFVPGPKASKH